MLCEEALITINGLKLGASEDSVLQVMTVGHSELRFTGKRHLVKLVSRDNEDIAVFLESDSRMVVNIYGTELELQGKASVAVGDTASIALLTLGEPLERVGGERQFWTYEIPGSNRSLVLMLDSSIVTNIQFDWGDAPD